MRENYVHDSLANFPYSSPIRYDYSYEKQRLVLQFPSNIRNHPIGAFSVAFSECIAAQEALIPKSFANVIAMKKDLYIGSEDDMAILAADLVLDADGKDLIWVEVALAQTHSDVSGKMARVLTQHPHLVGGVLVHLKQHPIWTKPDSNATTPADHVPWEGDWNAFAKKYFTQEFIVPNPDFFPGVIIKGSAFKWASDMSCTLAVFPSGWRLSHGPPPEVSHLRMH